MEKTNVMRTLDQKKIKYNCYEYPHEDGVVDGLGVATLLNEDPNKVFKTLVCVSKSKKNYVFVLPVNKELDLKKCAKSVSEKSVEMISVKELLPLTGYVRGGCSPIGMKKSFITVIHKTALDFDSIIFSAGKIGYQVEVNPLDLSKLIRVSFEDIVEE
jgi:Cys-tRNA(Pro)/Cys-tRNA(Cys) deacylase